MPPSYTGFTYSIVKERRRVYTQSMAVRLGKIAFESDHFPHFIDRERLLLPTLYSPLLRASRRDWISGCASLTPRQLIYAAG